VKQKFFFVSRKCSHLLSLDLPESKVTTTTTDKDIFKYVFEKKPDVIYLDLKKVVK